MIILEYNAFFEPCQVIQYYKLSRIKLWCQWEFSSGLVVKDPALSLLWRGFNPGPGNSLMLWVQPKKKFMVSKNISDSE